MSQNSHSSHQAQHVARALVVVSFTLEHSLTFHMHSSPTFYPTIYQTFFVVIFTRGFFPCADPSNVSFGPLAETHSPTYTNREQLVRLTDIRETDGCSSFCLTYHVPQDVRALFSSRECSCVAPHPVRWPQVFAERSLLVDRCGGLSSTVGATVGDSSRGVASHARARLALADSTLVAPPSTHDSSALLSAAAVDAHATCFTLACCTECCCSQGPTGRRRTKGEVPVRAKICVLSQRWRQEYIFVRELVVVHTPGRRPGHQVPGGPEVVRWHLPSTRS